MMARHRLLISAIVLAALQIGFLSWMIAGRAAIIRQGQEVLLKVEPVDPRDLLRGDYVRLGYDISRVPLTIITDKPSETELLEGRTIHVRLKSGEDNYWHAISASFGPLPSPAEGEVNIKGTVSSRWFAEQDATLLVDYGIERFYLPEGEGKDIERDMRLRSFAIRAAVSSDGTAQIKSLLDGDVVLYDEPLY
ncbi:GDYXXLXY domain-containing protein [Mesorhizobium sp. SB112]|uniref:GDYXXLXY domain-containing protein n=1 Tax=Mesorhizobium sp. SB112 TaxID=3151853 RepID=UPI003266C032